MVNGVGLACTQCADFIVEKRKRNQNSHKLTYSKLY